MQELVAHTARINDQLARYGVKFGIYKNGSFNERLFPFDAIARVIGAQEWAFLERGLIQRVRALNAYLADVYGSRRIIADGVVPEEFAISSPGYLAPCVGLTPPKGIYSHISGIDLVQARDGTWYVLEDNLRIPSGASYPLISRSICRRCSPETFRRNRVVDKRGYGQMYLDMNRIFPGNNAASPFESLAVDLVADVQGSSVTFDLHASNVYLRELPQIRINERSAETLIPLARRANVDYIWVHANATVLKGTFAYSMNELGVPTLVVEAGVGMRITPEVGEQLAVGMLSVLSEVGVWTGSVPLVRPPQVSTDGEVSYVNADVAGVFVPCLPFGKSVRQGQLVGRILDCGEGVVLQELHAPATGLLFTLREYPVVYPGNLIARVLGGVS